MTRRINGVYPKPSEELLECMMQHSFKDFHVKGFDYICIRRSADLTRKIYFFDGDVSQLPEVVNPHNHRYNFATTVLAGHMSNSQYVLNHSAGKVYNEFSYDTPLNGGAGFQWKQETKLYEVRRDFYAPSHGTSEYWMAARDFHTIRMHEAGTVLMLDQYNDVIPWGVPTTTFMADEVAPNLDGLYSRFKEWQILDYYHRICFLEEQWNAAWAIGQRSKRLSIFVN